MIYCGKECQLRDWGPEATGTSATSSENAATSSMFKHQDWCHRMKGYTAGESELSDLPFTFIKGLCLAFTSFSPSGHWLLLFFYFFLFFSLSLLNELPLCVCVCVCMCVCV